ncbi:hypothetical protein GCM10029976_033770 [Kribbella albertanoniae]
MIPAANRSVWKLPGTCAGIGRTTAARAAGGAPAGTVAGNAVTVQASWIGSVRKATPVVGGPGSALEFSA